jgi:hypothetical protein
MKELLGRTGCAPTRRSNEFVTPSSNVACVYHSDIYDPSFTLAQPKGARILQCYVRSTHTYVSMADVGATTVPIKRGVAPPKRLRQLEGPVLTYGSTWQAPYWIRCVSRPTMFRCTGGRGAEFTVTSDGRVS